MTCSAGSLSEHPGDLRPGDCPLAEDRGPIAGQVKQSRGDVSRTRPPIEDQIQAVAENFPNLLRIPHRRLSRPVRAGAGEGTAEPFNQRPRQGMRGDPHGDGPPFGDSRPGHQATGVG